MLFGKIGLWEILIIAGVVLLLFGPKRIARTIKGVAKRITGSADEPPTDRD